MEPYGKKPILIGYRFQDIGPTLKVWARRPHHMSRRWMVFAGEHLGIPEFQVGLVFWHGPESGDYHIGSYTTLWSARRGARRFFARKGSRNYGQVATESDLRSLKWN